MGSDRSGADKNPGRKPKKSGTLVSAYIEQDAYNALQAHCQITGQSKTKAIERAILSYCGATLKQAGGP
ncbi:MAG: ribbon-helix-helix domain-containing protein [Muribaculaceae bacterium]|nr:ribbon-helix-helix domain-containing protein [Muribaculaceae bacterium]